jgi:hypothetical protein
MQTGGRNAHPIAGNSHCAGESLDETGHALAADLYFLIALSAQQRQYLLPIFRIAWSAQGI